MLLLCLLRSLELGDDALHLLSRHATLLKNSRSALIGQLTEVFLTWCDDESRHVQGSRRNHHLCISLDKVSLRTVLLPWDDHADKLIALSPSYDVHHWLCLIATNRHRLIETTEQSLVAILALRNDDEGWNHEIPDYRNLLLIIERDDIGKVAREALPVGLQWQDATRTSLEVKMIGC